jgi:branched-chain amino acid transport system ATP-binding protein
MADLMLEVRGLSAGYHEAAVIRDVNIDVRAGEVVALLGPNGAGKTTTLGTISGLIRPMGGDVVYAGESIAGRGAQVIARKGVVHVPEGRGIFHTLTVGEHFRLGSRRDPLDQDVALTYFPALHQLLDRRAGLLSGGEQQMLAVGCGLARKPRLLLLDELSLGLAPVIVERLLPVIRRFAEEHGCGVLLVEQHVEMALSIADRAYVFSHGDIVIEETAESLLSNPALLLAGYLGDDQTRMLTEEEANAS